VMIVATMAGFRIAARYAERSKQLRQFVTALKILETEIFYAATPLPEACRRIAQRIPAPAGMTFERIAVKLRDGRGLMADAAWREALAESHGHLALKGIDRDVLMNFGHTLGVSDREDQIKHIHLAIAHLSAEETNARDEQQRNEKMWRYLGALLGLTVVILLY
jgi:stage III sporulation protein AB